jgi:predicted outer membrane protein
MMLRKTAALCVVGASVMSSVAFSQQAAPARPAAPAQPARPAQPQAQQPGQPQVQPAQSGQVQQQQQVAVSQQSMAACLAIANQEEIAIAKFASEKTKNDDVKEFTKMVISDHQEFLKKLQKFTPEAQKETLEQAATTNRSAVTTAGGTAAAAPAQAAPAERPIQQTGAVAGQATQVDMLQLHREMAQQCLADSKKKLSNQDSEKFDACFIGQQLGKHAAMKTTLTVLQRHASGEFAQVLADGLETTEEHLKQAEKIMDGLVDIQKGNGRRLADRNEKSSDSSGDK